MIVFRGIYDLTKVFDSIRSSYVETRSVEGECKGKLLGFYLLGVFIGTSRDIRWWPKRCEFLISTLTSAYWDDEILKSRWMTILDPICLNILSNDIRSSFRIAHIVIH